MSQILGALVGGVMEGINTGINYGLSGAQAAQARSENYAYNEAAAQAAYARQVAMQERYYTPKALLRQYQEAGLSPSMLFGGTPGQGGTSVPKGNGPGGPQAAFAPMSLINAAQAADLLASAEVKKEQAKELRGENEFGAAEIAKMAQDTATALEQAHLYKAEGMYKGLMYDYQNMINGITAATTKDQIREIIARADTQEAQADYWDRMAELTNLEFDFNTETYEERKQTIINTNKKLISDFLKNYSDIELNDTTQSSIITNCEMRYLEYLQKQQEILISDKVATAKLEEIKIEYKKLQNEIFKILVDAKTEQMKMTVQEKNTIRQGIFSILTTSAAVAGYGAIKGK